MKNVLVVGGAGYIGSHTVKMLKDAKYKRIYLKDIEKFLKF